MARPEEEFINGLSEKQTYMEAQDTKANELASIIRHNVKQLIGGK
ncbi:hypothetical protein [Pirellula sp. SH-Sr6A]|nr:hypothetical protein [Pirellula sp. SH-Sr6A]